MHMVLYQPEIPLNTGAIGRTCAITNTPLHLIRPYGFVMNEKYIKKAGLDYWDSLEMYEYNNFDDFLERNPKGEIFLATTHGKNIYSDMIYKENSYIVFGRESSGLPESIHTLYKDREIRIPMGDKKRSLNLSVAAGIFLYEGLRQLNFPSLS